MGVSVYQNTFAKLSGNGTQTITGIPFQPKAVIFWSAGMTGTSFLDGVSLSYGFSDGTDGMGVYATSNDNQATSDCLTATQFSTGTIPIALVDITGSAFDGTADLTAFTSDGFSLTWTNSTATTYTIHYMAIGGTDITNVKVGVQTIGTAATGNKAYTGVGFKPDFLLTANNGYVKASALSADEASGNCGLGISAMKSTTERWAISTASEGGRADSDTWRYQTNAKCFALLDHTTGTKTGEADFVSFDTDGFTWNYTTTGTNITNSKFIYLAVKGGIWDVGDHTIPATNSTVTTNTNATATLRGTMLFNIQSNTANLGVVNATNTLSIGGTDGTRQSVIVYCDNDAAATMANARRQNTSNCTYMTLANATASSSSNVSTGALSSFGTSDFSIAYTNSDTNARLGNYFAVSETSLTPFSGTKTHKYDVIGKVTASKTHKWNLLAVVAASKSHKFNTLKIVSVTKTHKYNTIVSIGVTSKTHKYNTLAAANTTKTHKYNVIGLVSTTKTHKYHTIVAIGVTSKTHKFHTIVVANTTKTHKFDTIVSVQTTKTHKYDTITAITTTTKTHKYDTVTTVATTKTHKFHTDAGLTQVSTTKTHLFNTLVAANTTKTHKYNTIVPIATTTKTHKYHVIALVEVTKTHKYNVIGLVSTTKTHKFHTIVAVATTKTHKFHTVVAISTTTKTHLYNLVNAVSTTKTHLYNTTVAANTTKTHKYDTVGLVTTLKTHLYNLGGLVSATKTHKYNTVTAIATTTKTHKFNTTVTANTTKTHKYNVIGLISTTKTHKYDVIGLVSTTKTHKWNTIAQVITTTKTHKYHLLLAITTTTKTHKYHTTIAVGTTTKTHKWNTVTSLIATKTHKYDKLSDNVTITVTKTHKYNVLEPIVPIPTGGTHVFVTFPDERPQKRIIDVISSIENIVRSNVEIYPDILNVARGSVEIMSEPELFPVARSAQILPPIIQEIRHKANCSRIGLELIEADPKAIGVNSLLELDIPQPIRLVASTELTKQKDYKIQSKTEIRNDKIPILLSADVEIRFGIPKIRIAATEIMPLEKYQTLNCLIDILKQDIVFE